MGDTLTMDRGVGDFVVSLPWSRYWGDGTDAAIIPEIIPRTGPVPARFLSFAGEFI